MMVLQIEILIELKKQSWGEKLSSVLNTLDL